MGQGVRGRGPRRRPGAGRCPAPRGTAAADPPGNRRVAARTSCAAPPRRCQSRPRPVRDHGVREPHAGRRPLLTAPATEVRVVEQLLRIAVGGHGLHDRAAALQAPGPDQRQPRVVATGRPGVAAGPPPALRRTAAAAAPPTRSRRRARRRATPRAAGRPPRAAARWRRTVRGRPGHRARRRAGPRAGSAGPGGSGTSRPSSAERGEELARGEVLEDRGAALAARRRASHSGPVSVPRVHVVRRNSRRSGSSSSRTVRVR